MSESSVEAMMVMERILDEKKVKDKGSKVRIQPMETKVEFQSEVDEVDIHEENDDTFVIAIAIAKLLSICA